MHPVGLESAEKSLLFNDVYIYENRPVLKDIVQGADPVLKHLRFFICFPPFLEKSLFFVSTHHYIECLNCPISKLLFSELGCHFA